MNYVTNFYTQLSDQSFHQKILKELIQNNDTFLFYLDKLHDVVHYVIFGKKVKLVQVIFQTDHWNQTMNFDILEYGIQRKKIAKNYLAEIDEVIQFNIILYPNSALFDRKEWSYRDEQLEFPQGYYQIFIYNLYYIHSHDKSSYRNLATLFDCFL